MDDARPVAARHITATALQIGWWMPLICLVVLLQAWAFALVMSPSTPVGALAPVGIALFLGNAAASFVTTRRELVALPVSRRALWRALVHFVCVLPAVAVLVTGAVALGLVSLRGDGTVPFSVVLLAPVWSCLLGGATLAIAAVHQRALLALRVAATRRDRRGSDSTFIGFVTVGVGAFLVRNQLPFTLDAAASGVGPVWLAAGSLLALGGVLYGPPPGARPLMIVPAARDHLFAGMFSRRSPLFDDPLAGMSKLLAREARLQLLWATGIVAVLSVTFAGVHAFWPGSGDISDGLPFSARPPFNGGLVMLGLALAGRRDGLGLLSVDLLRASARHLRSLPLRPAQIAAALILRRALGWTALWVSLMLVQMILDGPPAALRLDWLLLVMGADAALDAIRFSHGLATAGFVAMLFAVIPAFAIVALVVSLLPDGHPLALITVGGLGSLALAVAFRTHLENVRTGPNLYKEAAADVPLFAR